MYNRRMAWVPSRPLALLALLAAADGCGGTSALDVSVEVSACAAGCQVTRHLLLVLQGDAGGTCVYAWSRHAGSSDATLPTLPLAPGTTGSLRVIGSCADPCPRCAAESPFVVGVETQATLKLQPLAACGLPAGTFRPCSTCVAETGAAYCSGDERVTCEGGAPVRERCPGGCLDGACQQGCTKRVFYADADGDSYGNSGAKVEACTAPAGHVDRGGDCNDGAAAVHPGQTEFFAKPVGGSFDYNCDGKAEQEWTAVQGSCDWQGSPKQCVGGGWMMVVPACGQTAAFLGCAVQFGDCEMTGIIQQTQACR